MTTEQRHETVKSTSMDNADVTNGESPDADSKHDEPSPHSGVNEDGSAHPTRPQQATGPQQATWHEHNDLP